MFENITASEQRIRAYEEIRHFQGLSYFTQSLRHDDNFKNYTGISFSRKLEQDEEWIKSSNNI